jgi:hypothetical protein
MTKDSKPTTAATDKTDWAAFGTYKDEKTGIQFVLQKKGSSFSPRVGFIHKKTNDFASYGRIIPDFKVADLRKVNFIGYIIEGLLAIQDQANAEIAEAAEKDREVFLQRQAMQAKRALKKQEREKAQATAAPKKPVDAKPRPQKKQHSAPKKPVWNKPTQHIL